MEKSFLKVIAPQKFIPAIIANNENFEQSWQQRPAWVLANFSHIAYFPAAKIRDFMRQLRAEKTLIYDHDGAQAFLALWPDKAILSYRGTQVQELPGKEPGFFRRLLIRWFIRLPLNPLSLLFPGNDVIADLKFIQVPFDQKSRARVHRGFLEELDKIWNQIHTDLEKYIANRSLYVTGHSLGGAMATLTGMHRGCAGIITFGQPRTGRRIRDAFKSAYHHRYVNGDDPVTRLPPRLFGYYRHFGEKKYIQDSDGETSFIYDHSIIYYTENLVST